MPLRPLVVVLTLAVAIVAEASSLPDLADRLVGRSRSYVRSRAIGEMQKLSAADKAALVPLLLPGLQRKEPYERMNAAYAIGLLDEHARSSTDRIRPLLRDRSEMVRQQGRATLGRLGEGRAAAVAAEVVEYQRLRGSQDIAARNDRRATISRLGYILSADGERPPEGVATLAEALADPHEYTRHAAASGLYLVAKLSCADVLPAVSALLGGIRDADRNTAHGALRALQAMDLVPTDPDSERAAYDPDASTRRALGERLARDLGPTPACSAQRHLAR